MIERVNHTHTHTHTHKNQNHHSIFGKAMLQGKHLGKHQVKICGIKVQKSANEENGEKNCIGPVTIYTLTIIHSDPLFVKIFS